MKQISPACRVVTASMLSAVATSGANAGFMQFDLTPLFNADIVFSTLPGDSAVAADGQDMALATQSAVVASGDVDPVGLPDSGAVPFGAEIVQFGGYDSANSVRFGGGEGFTITPNVMATYNSLQLHGFGTISDADLDVTLNYADGSVTTRVVARNWTNLPPSETPLIQLLDSFNTTSGIVEDMDRLSIFVIGVPVDTNRQLDSFDVEQVNFGTNPTRPILTNIVAVTGDIRAIIPEPGVAAVGLLGTMMLTRRRRAV